LPVGAFDLKPIYLRIFLFEIICIICGIELFAKRISKESGRPLETSEFPNVLTVPFVDCGKIALCKTLFNINAFFHLVEKMCAMVRGILNSGNTLLNINIIDAKKILEAHKDPYKYPDLVVRVTGFTAFFAMLSEKFRELVVERIKSVNGDAE